MPDHEAFVEIVTSGSSFKISGSEAFVEKMIEALPALYPESSENSKVEARQADRNDADGGKETLDDFVARLGITNTEAATRKVTAFVYYLTEVEKSQTCTKSQIEDCFDRTGLTTPNNLHQVINNAAKAQNGAYVRSVRPGNYAVTTNGKNLVKEMIK